MNSDPSWQPRSDDREATLGDKPGEDPGSQHAPTAAINDGRAVPDDLPPPPVGEEAPAWIGRYKVRRLLGAGSFGCVYLADDAELKRSVAVKVPHKQSLEAFSDLNAFIDEAQILAQLDHPHIVPVFDIGRTDDGRCYIVSKYVDGVGLRDRIKRSRPSYGETARLLASVADALQYAHARGITHRDVKPGNIILDTGGEPYLCDFGLALKNESIGTGPGFVGTAQYMSPEQARGEGHLVDARSDVFSLGVVLYLMVTGKHPFCGDSVREVIRRILNDEPASPRQIVGDLPRELERTCLKAIAKRMLDRYETAGEFADDLCEFAVEASGPAAGRELSGASFRSQSMIGSIVPRGPCAFEESDSDFFMQLLPGPRDRGGLAPGVRFWKNRIEEQSPAKLLRVGVLYGPSGCGKSSIVRAGLLPRLSDNVESVQVAATASETKARIVDQIRRRFPEARGCGDLADTLLAVRRGEVAGERRLLLVIDQFEQWLQTHSEDDAAELVRAMRQCDGVRVQALLLVRDEFWMSVIRFLRQLDITLEEGANSRAVELLDKRHAGAVLAAFGRAYDQLPAELDPPQRQFIEAAVEELAEDERVVPVRLALFAELMRRRPWTPESLQKLGGAEGVGVAFLDQCFHSDRAPPEYRLHRRSAKLLLAALLPDGGQHLRGPRRTLKELADACEYAQDSVELRNLLRLLCDEQRLVSAVDPLGATAEEPREPLYELSHDYLVPSLRTWLQRELAETRRGRTQILLHRRSEFWNARPERKQLPTMMETLRIRLMTRPRQGAEGRQLAVSMCEVTVEQFRRCVPYHDVDGEICRWDTCPVTKASWYDAVRYCRWLTDEEKLGEEAMVYPSLDELDLDALHNPGAPMPEQLRELPGRLLDRTGYRLPTAAEWEHLCRAGAGTRFHFGEQNAYLPKFASMALSDHAGRHTQPVGQRMPNAWGLLDCHGNVNEWTHDRLGYGQGREGLGESQYFLCGGDYRSSARFNRCLHRVSFPPQTRFSFTGFRVVRTLDAP